MWCRWCTIVNDTIEEAGVVLGGGEIHVCQNLSDYILPVLVWSPQAVQGFVDNPEVFWTGVSIDNEWADDSDIVFWEKGTEEGVF